MKPIKAPPVSYKGMLITQWKPTAWDRLRILFGKPIRISVVGNVQPTLAVDTKKLIVK